VRLDAQELLEIPDPRESDRIRRSETQSASPASFRSIQYRTDPPVDLAYLHPLQLLALGAGRTPIINPAPVLLGASEKLEAGFLRELLPPTLASSQWDFLLRFGREEGQTVLKPLHQAQSRGVRLLDWRTAEGEAEARDALQEATAGFTRPAILQRYLAGIAEGEQRLWFLDGKLLAYVRKLPRQGDFRVDIDAGSPIAPTSLDRAERSAARLISRRLRERKIRLAAVDLIEGQVTDFNFTSPGLIVDMERVLGVDLARPIARALIGRR
jgi:glutathione synthase